MGMTLYDIEIRVEELETNADSLDIHTMVDKFSADVISEYVRLQPEAAYWFEAYMRKAIKTLPEDLRFDIVYQMANDDVFSNKMHKVQLVVEPMTDMVESSDMLMPK